MTGPIIGIDIGSQGAIAFLTPAGDLLEVVDMPTLKDGPAGRRNVNAPLINGNGLERWCNSIRRGRCVWSC
jgi:hypothetical protein